MNTNKNAIKSGNKKLKKPKPDCKVSVEQREHPIEYPNNLTFHEYHELTVGSAIHPALIKRNFFHIEGETIYDYLFISKKIPRKNAGRVTDAYIRQYQHLLLGGTWIQSLDPFNNWQAMEWGRIKPNFPRFDWQSQKPVKYESPPKTANRVTYFDIPNCILNKVARRYNVPDIQKVLFAKRGQKLHIKGQPQLFSTRGCAKGTLRQRISQNSFFFIQSQNTKLLQVGLTPVAHLCNSQLVQLISLLALCLQDLLNPLIFWSWFAQQIQKKIELQHLDIQITFWEWIKQHPEIPIILCEGEKKAACLLSLGFVAVALPGIWNGRVGKQDFDERLHPDLVPMAQAGRKFIILFDYETKAKTRWSVFQATVRTAKAIESAGCLCEVALLPGPEKGVDDFVVGQGVDANALLTAIIDDAKSLKDYQRSYRAKKWGLSKYKPDVTVNIKYLTQALCIPDLPEKCSSVPPLYDIAQEQLMSGQKIMVVSDSKRFIKKLEQSLSVKIYEELPEPGYGEKVTHSQNSTDIGIHPPKLRIWSVHSDNSGSEENVAFIKDITNAVKNLDALFTSPSLGTGVDIAEYHFDVVFGVFHAVSQTATECAQQLYRYRHKVPFHVWVAPRPPMIV